jgi:hypothetical protein
MPLLFYGTVDDRKKPVLHGANLRPLESSVFDHFRIDHLAPYRLLDHPSGYAVANHWWFVGRKHTAISWHHPRGTEQTLFMPALLDWMQSLELARTEFPELMPSPIIFRFNNYEGPFTYDE